MGRYAKELASIKFFLNISGGDKPELLWLPTHNICSNLKRMNSTGYKDFEYCFKWWPEFSGNINYPVPSGDARSPETAYLVTVLSGRNFYDTNNPHGQNRVSLLRYIHDRLVEAEAQGMSLYDLYVNKGYIKQGGVKPPGY